MEKGREEEEEFDGEEFEKNIKMKVRVKFFKSTAQDGKKFIIGSMTVVNRGDFPVIYIFPRGEGMNPTNQITSRPYDTAAEAREWANKRTEEIKEILRNFRTFEVPKDYEFEI